MRKGLLLFVSHGILNSVGKCYASDLGIENYPWGDEGFINRQKHILNSFRENIFVDVNDGSLYENYLSGTMYMRNMDGQVFEVSANFRDPEILETTSGVKTVTDVDALNNDLEGECDDFRTIEYGIYDYEWCHRKDIHQERRDQGGELDSRWNLGTYDRSLVVREGGNSSNTSATIVEVCCMITKS